MRLKLACAGFTAGHLVYLDTEEDMSNKIDKIVQLPDNKPRHWLTQFAE